MAKKIQATLINLDQRGVFLEMLYFSEWKICFICLFLSYLVYLSTYTVVTFLPSICIIKLLFLYLLVIWTVYNMHLDWFSDLRSFHTKFIIRKEIPRWQETELRLSLLKKDTGFTSLQLIPLDFSTSSEQFIGFYPSNVLAAHKWLS